MAQFRRRYSQGTALTGPLVLTYGKSNGEQVFELGDGLMTALVGLLNNKVAEAYAPTADATVVADLNELRTNLNAVIDALQTGFTITPPPSSSY